MQREERDEQTPWLAVVVRADRRRRQCRVRVAAGPAGRAAPGAGTERGQGTARDVRTPAGVGARGSGRSVRGRGDAGADAGLRTAAVQEPDDLCNTCHDLANYGIDPEPTSTGHKGQKGDRNSPTVLNAAAHFAQFWDGRAADVEAQAKGPVLNPVEMAMPGEARVVAVLESMPEYVELFRQAFPDEKQPVTYDNMARPSARSSAS